MTLAQTAVLDSFAPLLETLYINPSDVSKITVLADRLEVTHRPEGYSVTDVFPFAASPATHYDTTN